MNWQDKIYESLTETRTKRATQHTRSPQTRVKKPSKRGMKRRGSLIAQDIRTHGASKPKRSEAEAAKILQHWTNKNPGFEPSDKPHPHLTTAEKGQLGDTTARERSRTHGRR